MSRECRARAREIFCISLGSFRGVLFYRLTRSDCVVIYGRQLSMVSILNSRFVCRKIKKFEVFVWDITLFRRKTFALMRLLLFYSYIFLIT